MEPIPLHRPLYATLNGGMYRVRSHFSVTREKVGDGDHADVHQSLGDDEEA